MKCLILVSIYIIFHGLPFFKKYLLDARNLKCEICGLTFKFARNMGTHMKFHKNNDQFIPESGNNCKLLLK